MSRVYGSKINIDTKRVKDDYDRMFEIEGFKIWSDKELKEKFRIEGNLIFSLIEKYNIDISNIYDIACGDGFPAILFQNKEIKSYTGYDFSTTAIKSCKDKFEKNTNYSFIKKDVSDLKIGDFNSANLIISLGLFVCLNDKELEDLLKMISLCNNVYFYFRNTTSIISDRLTLDNFYSKEMETNYSAIYRTKQEYLDMFKKYNLDIIETDIIKGIKEREETAMIYYLLKTK